MLSQTIILVSAFALIITITTKPKSAQLTTTNTPVAIFHDKWFPYYMGNPAVRAQDILDWLNRFNIKSQILTADQLSDPQIFNSHNFKVLIHIYGNSFPFDAANNIKKFHAQGGCIISPGVPFCHPCLPLGFQDWELVLSPEDESLRDSSQPHTGKYSAKITKKSTADWIGISSQKIQATPGETYTIAAWVKTTGEVGKGKAKVPDYLFIRFWDHDQFKGQQGPVLPPDATNWTFIQQQVKLPPDITHIDVSLQIWSPSTSAVCLDDVVLVKGILKEQPPNAQIPQNLLSNPSFEKSGGRWQDLGHDSLWFSHDKIGTGDFYEPPREPIPPLKYLPANDPLDLHIIPWSKMKIWVRTMNPEMLPEEDEVIGIVGYQIKNQFYPALGIIKHYCPQFNGAIDIWTGTQLLTPADTSHWLMSIEVTGRAIAYCLKEKAILTTNQFSQIQKSATQKFKLPKPIENLKTVYEPKPFKGVFPKSQSPSKNLLVLDARPLPTDLRLALISLQGLVNRQEPQIYLIFDSIDEHWLNWLKQQGHTSTEKIIKDPWQLFEQFKNIPQSIIITDPNFPASLNIATMLASVKNAIIVSPDLAQKFDLPIIDLRNKFQTNTEAYKWAFDNLWPQLNHHVLACLYPHYQRLRDYLIQFKIFTFWVTGAIDGQEEGASPIKERQLMEDLFAKMPVNIPIMGYSWAGEGVGMGEGPGVTLFGEFAKYLVGSIDLSNMSVHSGTTFTEFKQQKIKLPELQKDKVYISFIISDGDNLPVLFLTHLRGLWNDETRGKLPLGWTVSPAAFDIMPNIIEYYYKTATPNDYFLTAVSGIGYTYPDIYAKRYKKKNRIFDEFLTQTAEFMQKMDLQAAWIMGITDKKLISRYAEIIPSITAIFPDYSRRPDITPDKANYLTANQTPVFHALTTWRQDATGPKAVDHLINEIKQFTPPSRPAFMHIFVINWLYNPTMLQQVAQALGHEYIVARPDQLAYLFKQAQQK